MLYFDLQSKNSLFKNMTKILSLVLILELRFLLPTSVTMSIFIQYLYWLDIKAIIFSGISKWFFSTTTLVKRILNENNGEIFLSINS